MSHVHENDIQPPRPMRAGEEPAPTAGDSAEFRLYTADQAAALLQVSPWWLRKKASARQVPCTFVGRYLRFSTADLDHIIRAGTRPPTR